MKDENEMKDENRRLTLTITIKKGRVQLRLKAQHTTVQPSPQGANTKSSQSVNDGLVEWSAVAVDRSRTQVRNLQDATCLLILCRDWNTEHEGQIADSNVLLKCYVYFIIKLLSAICAKIKQARLAPLHAKLLSVLT